MTPVESILENVKDTPGVSITNKFENDQYEIAIIDYDGDLLQWAYDKAKRVLRFEPVTIEISEDYADRYHPFDSCIKSCDGCSLLESGCAYRK